MITAITVQVNGKSYQMGLQGFNLSLSMVPNADNVNCYYAQQPVSEVITEGSFTGSVALGGTVNYHRLSLTPHGNGTHTENAAHILPYPQRFVPAELDKPFYLARLITVDIDNRENGDRVITQQAIAMALTNTGAEALIIKTLPNGPDKAGAKYSNTNPPYLEPGTGEMLQILGYKHLLVDLPSVDREVDEGVLSVHRGFFMENGSPRQGATITELIFVPDEAADGLYALQLSVPNITQDALPSSVVIYPLK